ncbi:ThiF family adenylyltransferase [Streptomyces yaizuensis]|uniref:ThiF family adenylyltransferase n=2 Tax=Streptomyces yaizuensis TaxID=2989713 RepID=A0ABQ5NWG5_9ACTN|nr:ThiF family adenylyltransferase [Streptomyces sp. YSPA8]
MLKPALRRAWRERQSVQFGVTGPVAVTLGPVDTATGALLELLDGTRGLPLLREEARSLGLPDGQLDALVGRLTAAGLLDDVTAGGPEAEALRRRTGAVDRLRPDLAALSVVDPAPGGGLRRLVSRQATRVQVRGAGRVGAAVAALLSASGVGRVEVVEGGHTEPWDVAPGGLPAEAVGERRDTAARRLVRAAAVLPARAVAAGGRGRGAGPGSGSAGAVAARGPGGARRGEPGLSLVVVCPRDGLAAHAPDPAAAADWIATGTPHLYAGVIEATGMVGPLVLPGGTACAGCLDRGRADRDPGWPRLVAQWRSGGRRAPVPACDLSLATAVAGTAAAHALSFLDGELPVSAGARWEVSLPLLDWRRERIAPHLDCSCGAVGKSEGQDTPGRARSHETMAG